MMEKFEVEFTAGRPESRQPLDRQATESSGNHPTDGQGSLSIEEAFSRLEALVGELEGGQKGLEESFRLYQQGMELVQYCSQKIDRVEKELIVLEGGEGQDG